jgi:hypothetical protein
VDKATLEKASGAVVEARHAVHIFRTSTETAEALADKARLAGLLADRAERRAAAWRLETQRRRDLYNVAAQTCTAERAAFGRYHDGGTACTMAEAAATEARRAAASALCLAMHAAADRAGYRRTAGVRAWEAVSACQHIAGLYTETGETNAAQCWTAEAGRWTMAAEAVK